MHNVLFGDKVILGLSINFTINKKQYLHKGAIN